MQCPRCDPWFHENSKKHTWRTHAPTGFANVVFSSCAVLPREYQLGDLASFSFRVHRNQTLLVR